MAHVGLLKALEEAGIAPDLIVGTSMGSIVGAMYAETRSSDILISRFREYIDSHEFDSTGLKAYRKESDDKEGFWQHMARRIGELIILSHSLSSPGVFKPEQFAKALRQLIETSRIEDLSIPFAAIAVDLLTGEKVVFTEGDVITAVMASSAIPGFLPPVEYDGKQLADGEASDLVPSTTAWELGAEFVVAMDVSRNLIPAPPLDNGLDILLRASAIKSKELTKRMLVTADVVIHPDISEYHWTEFDRMEDLVKIGYQSGRAKTGEIKRKMKRKARSIRRLFRKMAPKPFTRNP